MNKDAYKFSVLMSVYIRENPSFLDDALKSNLVEQTRKPDEMVLVCDGPLTDQLNNVIEKYKEQFPDILKVFQLQENKGLGYALNYGLSKCSYEWVARSDSDDICENNRFEVQIDYLKEHPNVELLSSFVREFDNDCKENIHIKILPVSHDEIVKYAKFRNPMNHMAVIFHKQAIIDAGSYLHLPYVEDYYLWLRVIKNGSRLANVDQCLVNARVGNGMLKRRSNREYISSWRCLNQFMLENNMIGKIVYLKNMFAVRAFIYMPINGKKLLYKYILRK